MDLTRGAVGSTGIAYRIDGPESAPAVVEVPTEPRVEVETPVEPVRA